MRIRTVRPVEDSVLDRLYTVQAVDTLFAYLTPRQRSVAAYVSLGMTQVEIADTLGCTRNNISRMFKAIQKRAKEAQIEYQAH